MGHFQDRAVHRNGYHARVKRAWIILAFCAAFSATADDLQRANELAWAKRFAEAEAMYRRLPQTHEVRLGLARVVMWQGRYAEAIALFEQLEGTDALEGKAMAQYWSGDLRAAARSFRRVLELDPDRAAARQSLNEILSTARPSQRVAVDGTRDDQPLDRIRAEVAASFFSDPQTRWTVSAGRYLLDAERFAREADGLFA
ncbi:MAG TPA: tetratricopeptide repeat protein, partial [Salinarimonas sp.]|nr:tetratricopeptide repeat protein [Salinarimonas sp.]